MDENEKTNDQNQEPIEQESSIENDANSTNIELDPYKKPTIRWLFLSSIICYIGVIIGIASLTVILGIIFKTGNSIEKYESIFNIIIFYVIYSFLIAWFYYIYKKRNLKLNQITTYQLNFDNLKYLFIVIPLYVFIACTSTYTLIFYEFIYPDFIIENIFNKQYFESNNIIQNLFILICFTIFAPIVEELLFRNIVLHRLNAKWGLTTALIIGSLIFAIPHLYFIETFVIGFLFCLIYIKTRSIIITMILHSIYNLIATFDVLGILFKALDLIDSNSEFDNNSEYLLIALIIISLSILVYVCVRIFPKKNTKLPYYYLKDLHSNKDKDLFLE